MIKKMCIHGAHIIDIACHVGCTERTVLRLSNQTVCFETQPGQQLHHDRRVTKAIVAGKRCLLSFANNILG